MLYSQRMPLKTRQIDVTQLFVTVDGTGVDPVIGGLDKKIVKEVEEVSTGIYKITLKSKARRPLFLVGHAMITEDAVLTFVASDEESITVKTKVLDTGAFAVDDTQFALTIGYHGDKTLY